MTKTTGTFAGTGEWDDQTKTFTLTGPAGPAGPAGPPGPQGPAGGDGGGTDPNPPEGGGGTFRLGDRPFREDSSWNKKVPSNAKYSKLAWPAPSSDGGYNYTVGNHDYTPAIYLAEDVDPLVAITHPDSWGRPAGTVQVKIKKGVSGAGGTDGELLAIDNDVVHNMWQFVRVDDTHGTASAYAFCHVLNDTGWGSKSPFLGAGIMANGASMLCGILVEAETDKGVIPHALQLVTDKELTKWGVVGEAINSDGGENGIVYESDLLAIPRNATMPSGLSPLSKIIFKCLQEYGCFVSDVAVGCTKFRMQQNAYSDAIVQETWPNMQKIIPMLQKVG